MTTAPATPQQIRDRLLQAIDSQSNICNMVAVLEVITNLEKYPITKEALEETRLGKLINDVRKKTKDEDLAKRAKKLLRNWQKLIEPGQNDTPSRGAQVTPGSTNGGSHPCRTDTPPAAPLLSKIVPELKNRNDIHNACSPAAEKSKGRKPRGDQRQSPHLMNKMHKTFTYGQIASTPPTNGFSGSPEPFSEKQDAPSDRNLAEHPENDKLNKIPVNAVKPHPSSPGLTKIPSTSSLLKTSVLQQQIRLEGSEGEKQQPRSPQYSLSPHHSTLGTVAKKSSANASKGTLLSQSHDSVQVPPHLPLTPSTKPSRTDALSHELEDPFSYNKSSERNSQSLNNSTTQGPSELSRHNLSSEVSKSVSEGVSSSKKRKKYRSRDYTVNLQPSEDRTKPVRLKERRLTFDPVTGQIRPLTPKESHQEDESHEPPVFQPPRTETIQPKQPTTAPNPFQQTNWKELSRNEIIQSYLSRQSNVLTSSGAQTHGAHFFMTEYLKEEEHSGKEARQVHGLVPSSSTAERPGVSREVTREDLQKVHWSGVNGCYDTKGNWYDWTDCISLDCHGDETNLNILPYVCLD
ncbi:mediator of RNA polymerase II transcription subunit 26 [Trichomycterus rosablanca]|uniref:mediator of RNA polymerase II transcription subunit 26 n=1 Tax=Trichomycterus rosablanca TaxID=2290929 RepID=UPI002F3595B9